MDTSIAERMVCEIEKGHVMKHYACCQVSTAIEVLINPAVFPGHSCRKKLPTGTFWCP